MKKTFNLAKSCGYVLVALTGAVFLGFLFTEMMVNVYDIGYKVREAELKAQAYEGLKKVVEQQNIQIQLLQLQLQMMRGQNVQPNCPFDEPDHSVLKRDRSAMDTRSGVPTMLPNPDRSDPTEPWILGNPKA